MNQISLRRECLSPCWTNPMDLALRGDWALEWGSFIKIIFTAGIVIGEERDLLFWDKNKEIGLVTTNLVYNLLINSHRPQEVKVHSISVWTGIIPLKIKCFGWLCINEKILTWDGL